MTESVSYILGFSSELIIDRKSDGKTPIRDLKVGQLLEAKVQKTVTERQAQLFIQGKSVLAKTYVPLKSGEILLLRVTQAGAQPRFQLVETRTGDFLILPRMSIEAMVRPGIFDLLLRILRNHGGNTRLTQALKGLDFLAQQLAGRTYNGDKTFLKSLIHTSGLSWESKLRNLFAHSRSLPEPVIKSLVQGDLKALAMSLGSDTSIRGESVHELIRTLAEGIEQLQLLNSHSSQQSGRYLIPLPVPLDEMVRFGQILIDLGKENACEKNPSQRVITVSLLLEMSNLGNLRADLFLLKDAVNGCFEVENDEVKGFVEQHLPNLVTKLRHSGFTVQRITCRASDPQVLSSTNFFDELIRKDGGILNIVI
ncbi:MAG: flagellar hook-length control protein FliK [Deltaproteobacteria bacterium]|nr:flagellar hook-length control protein FliK [Deltaproteobacteria bacterium]MBW1993412.1 flagellar hook-length control protein FliK [Deltaproteobacteria bacterium]MBW2153634.1 flagellar hook-length control protein FliK [Deltaproteobacteria bacterium]